METLQTVIERCNHAANYELFTQKSQRVAYIHATETDPNLRTRVAIGMFNNHKAFKIRPAPRKIAL